MCEGRTPSGATAETVSESCVCVCFGCRRSHVPGGWGVRGTVDGRRGGVGVAAGIKPSEPWTVSDLTVPPSPSPPLLGWEDPGEVDGTRGHRVQEVHLGERRVELRHRHVGGDVIWREALLGHVQPGCKFFLCIKRPVMSLPCDCYVLPFGTGCWHETVSY